jgi:glucuronoarabinoxylan endo-1,4-beta-xylanase
MKRKGYNFSHVLVLALMLSSLGILLAFCSKKGNNSGGGGTPPLPKAEVTVSANDNYQVIEGFGCATVFVPATTSLSADECDRLFGKADGQVGLNILRIRIATDNGWRAIELLNAKQAIQRGAKVIATPESSGAVQDQQQSHRRIINSR